MAGGLLTEALAASGGQLVPIDSEHNALFQCLPPGASADPDGAGVVSLVLTASGGPFLDTPVAALDGVTPDAACRHPNWDMGRKISVDSATMMNKGLEVIEACRLFNVPPEKVRVVIHPQSIIHSMVAFCDGSVKAQMGVPDMRVPIQLALSYPQRLPSSFPRLDWTTLKELTFDVPDLQKFRCLALAYDAVRAGGTAAAVLNAANEVAVARFLQREIRFDQIEAVIEAALCAHAVQSCPSVEEILQADAWARHFAHRQMF